jgi:uncharacterized protein YjbJ (UPF0337 family)
MNWDSFDSNCMQFKGWVEQKWAKFSKDDIDFIHGSRDRLVGRLQEKYGMTAKLAEQEADEWYGAAASGKIPTSSL